MQAIPRFKLVWLTLSATVSEGAKVPFPDVPELRDKRIIGLETYSDNLLTATPDLQPVVPSGDLPALTLVLKENSTERMQDVPLSTLQSTNVGGIWKQTRPFVVNWQSSFVRLVAAVGTLPCTVPLMVFYED